MVKYSWRRFLAASLNGELYFPRMCVAPATHWSGGFLPSIWLSECMLAMAIIQASYATSADPLASSLLVLAPLFKMVDAGPSGRGKGERKLVPHAW
jgi:hypothetical protein